MSATVTVHAPGVKWGGEHPRPCKAAKDRAIINLKMMIVRKETKR